MVVQESIWLPGDIVQRLLADFPGEQLQALQSCLKEYRGKEQHRVIRCVIQLSNGDVERLRHFIRAANTDYRDVIYWAEYEKRDRRILDLSVPFRSS